MIQNGLFYSFYRASILSFIILVLLKLIEAQFAYTDTFWKSFGTIFSRIFIFTHGVWFTADLLLKQYLALPSFLKQFLKPLIERTHKRSLKAFVNRLCLLLSLTLPIYLLLYVIVSKYHPFTVYDTYEFTSLRAIAFFFFFVPFLITLGDLKTQLDLINLQRLSEIQKERLLKKKEEQLFKAKLQPHFLFNTLNSIAALIRLSPEKAETLVSNLSDFFRKTLEISDKEFVPLSEELSIIQHLLDIENVRFGDRLVPIINVDETLLGVRIPSLLLQPLVENAVKHGVEKSIKPVKIILSISIENNMLHCSVEDSGKGADLSDIDTHRYGLKTTINRLRFYYGEHFIPVIETKPNEGFKISLKIPMEKTL